jgi:hypothetical protein
MTMILECANPKCKSTTTLPPQTHCYAELGSGDSVWCCSTQCRLAVESRDQSFTGTCPTCGQEYHKVVVVPMKMCDLVGPLVGTKDSVKKAVAAIIELNKKNCTCENNGDLCPSCQQTEDVDMATEHAVTVLEEYVERNEDVVPRPELSELEFSALSLLVNFGKEKLCV